MNISLSLWTLIPLGCAALWGFVSMAVALGIGVRDLLSVEKAEPTTEK